MGAMDSEHRRLEAEILRERAEEAARQARPQPHAGVSIEGTFREVGALVTPVPQK